MRVALLSREYPPDVYGGAGVHVEHLARELARRVEVEVRAFGAPRPEAAGGPPVTAVQPWAALEGPEPYRSALGVLSADLAMVAGLSADLVHSHTWYTNLAGHLAKLAHGIPHLMTTHSLEPLRPWKREQLGEGGYALSCFAERIAVEAADGVVAVSRAMREDVLRSYPAVDPGRVEVIHNGVDAEVYRPGTGTELVRALGVEPDRPLVVFVGRITRQKGLTHLVRAIPAIDPRAQVVLAAGAPDTEEIGREVGEAVEGAQRERRGVVWIERMLDRAESVQLLAQATVFVCPSIYEPLGIVNLEAMACQAPVVASAVGGIPEVIEDGVTGTLVATGDAHPETGEPLDPPGFSARLAAAVNDLLADPARARAFGQAGRRRVLERFTWPAVADRTVELYERVLASR